MKCRICGSLALDPPVALNERFFCTGESFRYLRCAICDTLQIEDIPDNLPKYYPDNYYSFAPKLFSIRRFVRRVLRPEPLPAWLEGFGKSATFLDVGCGEGHLIDDLKRWGFRAVSGYDPFSKSYFERPVNHFDVVMMHHSLEHVPDPHSSLAEARAWLKPAGRLIVRIPVRQGEPWRRFGWDWVHLDPPRHLHVWTVSGFVEMAAANGFSLVKQGFDTTLFSIYGSELSQRGIPLDGIDIPIERIPELNAECEAINGRGDGDSAWFLLERSPDHT